MRRANTHIACLRSELPGKDTALPMTDTLSARPDNSTIGTAHARAVASTAADASADKSTTTTTDEGGSPPHCTQPHCAQPHCAQPQHTSPQCPASSAAPSGRLPPPNHPGTAAEAAAWYALCLGWPVVPGMPVLAVLGCRVPGAARLGAVDVPALVGAAALERLSKCTRTVGPITDGQGRIRFLVDLGEDDADEHIWLADWRAAGVDLRVAGEGAYCPLPTPGMGGRSRVVWAVPPDPGQPALPAAREITAALDRAVRDAYPALWHVPTRGPAA
jgi:hypothetical protein